MTFDKCFLVDAATAAHQVEGNNTHNDCRAMEHMKNTSYAEPSLDAVDHYNRYEEDIKLLAAAGLNACRFSIEARKVIRQVAPHVKVCLTLSLHDIQAMPGGEELAGKEWAEFEWQKGYSMTFGLIAVDRATQIRYPKESLNVLGSFAK